MPSNKYSFGCEELILQPISDQDLDFLFELYSITRADEMALSGWSQADVQNFLFMQFNLQHAQYMKNYSNPSFDLIKLGDNTIGRLYVNRGNSEIRIIDIAILPDFRKRGVAKFLMNQIIQESMDVNKKITLHVEQNNPILAWYSNLGFKTISEIGIYYYMELNPS